MYICVCKAVNERTIRRVAREDGVTSLRELVRRTGLGTGCGKCVPEARRRLDDVRAATHDQADPGRTDSVAVA